jgi:hypothetical protein
MPIFNGLALAQSPATADAAGAALDAAAAADDAAGAADDVSDDVVLLEQPASRSPAAAATPIQPFTLIKISFNWLSLA